MPLPSTSSDQCLPGSWKLELNSRTKKFLIVTSISPSQAYFSYPRLLDTNQEINKGVFVIQYQNQLKRKSKRPVKILDSYLTLTTIHQGFFNHSIT